MKDKLTGKINNETLTKAICNKGFSGNSDILPRSNFGVGRQESSPQSLTAYSLKRYQQGEEKDSINENDRVNGLKMKNNDMKEKRFSFFADPQEREAESQPTFGTLPFARHTSQRFAKAKEPNFAVPPHYPNINFISEKFYDTLANLSYSSTYHFKILPILGTRTENLNSNIMKRIFTFFAAFLVLSVVSFGQTTQEEYNYITKGYKVQIESGLDMKKGYTLKDLGDWGLTFGAEKRNVEFKGLYRTNETKPCAIMMIYKRTDISNGATYYICIPHPKSEESIWNSTLEFINTNADEKNVSMSKTIIWALMKFAAQEATL